MMKSIFCSVIEEKIHYVIDVYSNLSVVGWFIIWVSLQTRAVTIWNSFLTVVRRHSVTILILHGGNDFSVSIVRRSKREVQHLTVAQINKDLNRHTYRPRSLVWQLDLNLQPSNQPTQPPHHQSIHIPTEKRDLSKYWPSRAAWFSAF